MAVSASWRRDATPVQQSAGASSLNTHDSHSLCRPRWCRGSGNLGSSYQARVQLAEDRAPYQLLRQPSRASSRPRLNPATGNISGNSDPGG